MATTNFVHRVTPIQADWLNDVDSVTYYNLGNGEKVLVGNQNMFGYDTNAVGSIYGDVGTPTSIQHMTRIVMRSNGDNTTYRGGTALYVEARDADTTTALTKGALYGVHSSVVPSFARNNVPYDDVACFTFGNTTGTIGAKATDAIYGSHNAFAFTGTSEFYSLITMDTNADVGIVLGGRIATFGLDFGLTNMVAGTAIRFGNGQSLVARNSAGTQDRTVFKYTTGDILEIGSAATARVDIKLPMIATVGVQVTGGLQVNSGYISTSLPASITTATYSILSTDNNLTFNRGGGVVLTMPSAGSFNGRELWFRTVTAGAITSASNDVVPLVGGAAGTAILAATAGRWAKLVSDGAVWQIMAGN